MHDHAAFDGLASFRRQSLGRTRYQISPLDKGSVGDEDNR